MTTMRWVAALATVGCAETGWTGAPAPADVGTALGPAVTAVIGADGGALASADGGFRLDVPAGALDADTELSVQPITNTAWGGLGDAYRVTPDVAFAVPARVSVAYTDADLVGTTAEALGVAAQDGDGFWSEVPGGSADAGELAVETGDLASSDFAAHWRIRLDPAEATVRPAGSLDLALTATAAVLDWPEDPGTKLGPPAAWVHPEPVTWTVRGSPLGTVSGDPAGATYTAPGGRNADGADNVVRAELPIGARSIAPESLVHVREVGTPETATTTVPRVDGIADWLGYTSSNQPDYGYAADVRWVAVESEAGVTTYAPIGTVSFRPNVVGCDWSPVVVDIDPDEGELVIDETTTPPTYSGWGVTVWEVTIACPDAPVVHLPLPAPWFGDADGTLPTLGTVKHQDGARVIEDTRPIEQGDIYWLFTEQ